MRRSNRASTNISPPATRHLTFASTRRIVAVILGSALVSAPVVAQERGTRSPISIGNHPDVDGLRINFRDRDLGHVNGINVTIWSPYEPMSGRVKGMALGLPMTGAEDIEGFATGLFGAGANRNLTGFAVAPVGFGAGNRVKGIAIAGIGVGTGGSLEGLVIGGIGAGAAGDARGIILGGIGAGVGGDFTGIGADGVGMCVAGDAHGLLIGLINYARSVNGLQVGLINIIDSARSHPVLPFVNWQN